MSATPESHSARYFALLYASAAQRPVLEALFGIEREVFDSLRAGLDHHVAHSRLQWWREECERAAGGRAVHPLTRALVSALRGAPALAGAVSAPPAPSAAKPTTQQQAIPLPQLAGLCGIVDVAVWDLAGATFETRRELDAYCQRWAAGMIEPLIATAASAVASITAPTPAATATAVGASTSRAAATSATAASTPEAIAVAAGTSTSAAAATPGASATRIAEWHALGAAMREVELLADFAREAHYGRIRVPLDELERANVNINALSKTPWPDAVAQLLRARHKSLRNDIARILANVDREQQPALRGLLVWAALAWRSSHRAGRALPNRLQPGRFDAISDAWFAWRIARRATIGRFRLN
jgi:phytoene/squalene synthetase